MRRRPLIAGVVLAALAAAAGVLVYKAVASGPPGSPAPRYRVTLREARKASFPVYYPGDVVAGLPLTTIIRSHNAGPVPDIDFIYGDCTGADSCAPPLEVQVWPTCARNLAVYATTTAPVPVPQAAAPVPATVREVPAAFLEDSRRLEIQTGISTIVIFAENREQALQVADSLRGLNVDVGPRVPLPQPPPHALAGKLTCDGLDR